jgi:protein-L-isoaspartate(D-aspartate) O-methyltransferase
MRTVPREAFLPQSLKEFAYDDSPLRSTPIRPYRNLTSAFMIEALNSRVEKPSWRLGLDRYAAAVLSRIAGARLYG